MSNDDDPSNLSRNELFRLIETLVRRLEDNADSVRQITQQFESHRFNIGKLELEVRVMAETMKQIETRTRYIYGNGTSGEDSIVTRLKEHDNTLASLQKTVSQVSEVDLRKAMLRYSAIFSTISALLVGVVLHFLKG